MATEGYYKFATEIASLGVPSVEVNIAGRAIYVGTSGTVLKLKVADGTYITFTSPPVGVLPVAFLSIHADTNCSNLVALT